MYIFIKKVWIYLLFLFLSVIFFHKILIHSDEMLYPAGDMTIYSFRESFLVDSIKNLREIPLWNPYMFGGHPTLSSSEIPLFYPLHIFFFFLPIDPTFGYLFILDIFLFGTFTYLFVKKIGLDKLSSIISSFIAMFSGATILYIYPGQISILDGFIWLPLLLLFCELIIQKKIISYAIFLGIIVGLMLLSGTLQISLINLFIVMSFFIFRIFFFKKDKLKLMLLPIISTLIGILLSAIQLIPGLEFAQLSARFDGLDYAYASDFSLHPYQLITFFLPHFFGSPTVPNTYWGINGNFWSLCGYIGIFPLVLSSIAILCKRSKYTYFFVFAAIFAVLFSFGKFGFVFQFFYNFVPGFNFFRVPARFLFIYSFSIAILSGIGFSVLVNSFRPKILFNVVKSLAFLLFASIGFFLLTYFNKEYFINILTSKGYALGNNLNGIYSLIVKDAGVLMLLLFLSFVLLFVKIKKLLNEYVFFFFAFLIILFDLWFFGLEFYNTKKPEEVFKNTAEINQILKDKTTFRVFDFEGNAFPLTGRNRIESLTGFDALYLSYYRDFLWLSGDHANTPYESFFTFYNIRNLNILRLLNTKYILANKNVFDFGNINLEKISPNLYKIKETLPRAYIVPNAIIVKNKKELMENLQNKYFNFKKNILLEKKPNVSIKNSTHYKEAKITSYKPNRIDLYMPMENPGFLVLSEIWYPGWKSFVNGKQTEIYKTNYILRSIYLGKGLKTVSFIYDPLSYKIGKLISIFSLILLMIYIVFYINRHKLKKND